MRAGPIVPKEITDQCTKGCSLLIEGGPGSGKTILALSLLQSLKASGLRTIFASTRVPIARLIEATPLCKTLGLESLVDASTQRSLPEGPGIVRVPLVDVSDLSMFLLKHAARNAVIAIDPLDALLEKEKRSLPEVYTALTDAINRTPGTLILTTEHPGNRSPLEDVVDGYITLAVEELGGDRVRFLRVEKMRGRSISTFNYLFTLTDGIFKAYDPQDWWLHSRPLLASKLPEPVPEKGNYFSTGVPKLDRLLGGGYRQGSTVGIELELDAPHELFDLTFLPTALDFLAKKRPMIILPPGSRDEEGIWETVRHIFDQKVWDYIKPNVIHGHVTVLCLGANPKENSPEALGGDIESDLVIWRKTRKEIKYRFGQPILYVLGYDTLARRYGVRQVKPLIGKHLIETRQLGDLMVSIVTDDLSIKRHLLAVSDYYFQLRLARGIPILRGIKPRTSPHVVSLVNDSGSPRIDLDVIS